MRLPRFPRFSPRRLVVGGALLTAGMIASTLVAASGTVSDTLTAAASGAGPTAPVGRRDLQVTLQAAGTLQRAYEWTVNHLAVATPVAPAGTAPAGGSGSTVALVEQKPSGISTLIAVLAAGAPVDRGTTVYSVDAEPVVALLGPVPAWRTLQDGVSAGADVRQLEENLTALGLGGGLTVNEEFTSATAAAVEKWEAAIGRSDPAGSIELGEVVFVPEPGVVVQQTAAVGNAVRAGAPVLTVGSLSQVITDGVDVDAVGSGAVASPVVARGQAGPEAAGSVAAVGRDVVEDQIQITIALTTPEPSRSTGSPATVTLNGDSRKGALAAPVAALVDGPGGTPAVRVVDTQNERVVAVRTGIVADGGVEITSGLNGGELVRLPG